MKRSRDDSGHQHHGRVPPRSAPGRGGGSEANRTTPISSAKTGSEGSTLSQPLAQMIVTPTRGFAKTSGPRSVGSDQEETSRAVSAAASFPSFVGEVKEGDSRLPVVQYREEILQAVRQHATVVVVGETGSGKSTQIPQFLSDALSQGRLFSRHAASVATNSNTDESVSSNIVPKDDATKGKVKTVSPRPTGIVACTQPRRVAAVTVAKRVAAEKGGKIGEEVGYAIRFDDCSSSRTRIKYLTDGVLLREAMVDPMLAKYSVIVLDEAHERSLQTDILMGLLKRLQSVRPHDLKVVVMSATLEARTFIDFFKDPILVTIRGRQHTVDVYYTTEPEPDYVDACLLTCLQIHEEETDEGGVLVFLPGQEDIEALKQLLQAHLPTITQPAFLAGAAAEDTASIDPSTPEPSHDVNTTKDGVTYFSAPTSFIVHTLYAAMTPEQQLRAFDIIPSNKRVRKFVISTNIAETSVTIPGIRYVVDPGLAKIRDLHSGSYVDMLHICPVSQSQSNQRAGRAGREAPGKCFRLYPESEFSKLPISSVPEIQRSNISHVLLQLVVMGIHDPITFPYVSPPSIASIKKGLEELVLLGAISNSPVAGGSDRVDGSGSQGKCSGIHISLTPLGREMSLLPLLPNMAYLLLAARRFGCVAEILTIVSLLSSDNVFLTPQDEEGRKAASRAHAALGTQVDGDFISLLNIYQAWIQAKRDRTWAARQYLNIRALQHAEQVQQQLADILVNQVYRSASRGGGSGAKDVNGAMVSAPLLSSCWPEREPVLRCLAYGLFSQVAMRKLPSDAVSSSAGKVGGVVDRSGKLIFSDKHHRQRSSGNTHGDTMYVTMRGGTEVHIHPSSVMFDMSVHPTKRERLPKYVVFAEQVLTSKCYIRYASRIEGEWLTELHPELYRNPHGSSRGNTNVASNVPSVASHSANKASQRGLVGASSLGVSKASQPPYIEPSLLGKRKEK